MRHQSPIVLLLAILSIGPAFAQTARIAGAVTDPSGAAAPNAEVVAESRDRGLRRSTRTNESGLYAIPLLPPGAYILTVHAAGFRTVQREGITLDAGQPARFNFSLTLGETSESLTVSGNAAPVNLENGAQATTIDAAFVRNLPLNGRSFQALLSLAPGVTPTTNDQVGGFNVNGQRSTANAFTIDGASANIASPYQASPGFAYGGGNVLATTPGGATQSVASMEELQEITLQTAGYGAQFGGQPGAQVALVTRSGANQFHGTLYEFFRNEKLDANDWFLNRLGTPRQELRENNAGGVLGGPIWKDHAFFFFSYEADPYRIPNAQRGLTPNAAYRSRAAPALRPLLDALPLPNTANAVAAGFTPGPNSGAFVNSAPERGSTGAAGVKWDENWNRRFSTFARYHRAPSRIADADVATDGALYTNTQTFTAGATYIVSPRAVADLRLNYSRNASGQQISASGRSGAIPPPDAALTPPGSGLTVGASSIVYQLFDADNDALRLGRQAKFVMHQFELGETITWSLGRHRVSAGGDWRRLFPRFDANPYILSLSIRDATAGAATATFGKGEAATLLMHSLGLFAADTWNATRRLSIDWGQRWELVTPPTAAAGPKPYAAQNFDPNNPAAATFAPAGAPLWKTRYRNFAPRLGLAYQARVAPQFTTVLRASFGVQYDLGLGIVAAISSLAPFTRFGPSVSGSYPAILGQVNVPPVSTGKVANTSGIEFFDPNLRLPYTTAWTFGLEQSLGAGQSLALNYAGNSAHRLLRLVGSQAGNAQGGIVLAQSNLGYSDYNALQAQYRRRLTRAWQAIVNYTWSHAIDNSSAEVALGSGPMLPGRADSSFDVRHAFSTAVSYNLHSPPACAGRLVDRPAGARVFGQAGGCLLFHGQLRRRRLRQHSAASRSRGGAKAVAGGPHAAARPALESGGVCDPRRRARRGKPRAQLRARIWLESVGSGRASHVPPGGAMAAPGRHRGLQLSQPSQLPGPERAPVHGAGWPIHAGGFVRSGADDAGPCGQRRQRRIEPDPCLRHAAGCATGNAAELLTPFISGTVYESPQLLMPVNWGFRRLSPKLPKLPTPFRKLMYPERPC
jgi:hypothetical protein